MGVSRPYDRTKESGNFCRCHDVSPCPLVAVGTQRKCWNARVFPKLGVDRLCHQPACHAGP